MRLALPSLLILAYILVSLVGVMPVRPMTRIASGMLLLPISLKYLIYERIGRSFIAPDLPGPLLLLLEALYAAMVILFFLLLLKDGLALLLWLGRCMGASWQMPFSPTVRSAGIVSAALALAVFGTWQSVRVPDVRTVELSLPRIPAALDGFSIVQITDVHIGPFLKGDWLQRVVEKTNALRPDLVALTGDLIDGTPDALKYDIAPLGDLNAQYGVFGVTGNHEYYFHVNAWLPVFEGLGVTMLHNEHKTLSVGGSTNLVIAGIPDPTETRFGGPGPDLHQALDGAPDALRLLLAHRPDGASGSDHVDIQLSGHTHGGLLFFLKWLLASFNGGLVQGLYNFNGTALYVSPGTGLWSGFSCRLGVPSEITRIVLRAPDKQVYSG
jgi:predicted MPP superfamily phosphohydrolase